MYFEVVIPSLLFPILPQINTLLLVIQQRWVETSSTKPNLALRVHRSQLSHTDLPHSRFQTELFPYPFKLQIPPPSHSYWLTAAVNLDPPHSYQVTTTVNLEKVHKPLTEAMAFTDPCGPFLQLSHVLFNKSITKSSFRGQSYFIWTKFATYTETLEMYFQSAQSQAFGNYSQSLETLTGDMTLFTIFLFYVENTHTRAPSTNICTFYEKWK